eukprot:7391162-Prymnesium_polylepis.4
MGAHQLRVGPATIDPRRADTCGRAAGPRASGAAGRHRRRIALGDGVRANGRGVQCTVTACDARRYSL